MKILMTADTVGGVWTYAMELIRALHAHRIDVVLATMGRRMTPEQREDCERVRCLAVFESSFKLEWMDDPWPDLCSSADWLLDIESQTHPDVIHINGYFHAALPWSAPTVVVCHSCVLSWWQAVNREAAPESAWGRYREWVMLGLRAADHVVAPSHAMLECIHRHYGAQRHESIIPNGRAASFLAPRYKHKLILSVGRIWDEAKNVLALDRIADRLPWPVYVAGDCAPPPGADGGFAAPNVNRLGQLPSPEVARWMGRASIYCLPAKYEPFGLSVLEAALSNCALVLGDIASLRENWEGAALFAAPDDGDELARQLTTLAANPTLRTRFAGLARKRAADFSPQRMAQSYKEIYAAVVANRQTAIPKGQEASACAS